jgi:hypothetical protein
MAARQLTTPYCIARSWRAASWSWWSSRRPAARRRRFTYAEKMCQWRLQAKSATCIPSTIRERRSPLRLMPLPRRQDCGG